jgi:hypothetical protein
VIGRAWVRGAFAAHIAAKAPRMTGDVDLRLPTQPKLTFAHATQRIV